MEICINQVGIFKWPYYGNEKSYWTALFGAETSLNYFEKSKEICIWDSFARINKDFCILQGVSLVLSPKQYITMGGRSKVLAIVYSKNLLISDIKDIIEISWYFLTVAISRYFRMMHYIAIQNAHLWYYTTSQEFGYSVFDRTRPG